VIGLLECRHHVEDHVLMVVFLDACEIQIRRKPALRADKHFPQARPALEGEPIQDAALREKLKKEGQHDFLLRDHDVSQAGFIGIALHLCLRQHSLAVLSHGFAPAERDTLTNKRQVLS
jgi:hypothetical protein